MKQTLRQELVSYMLVLQSEFEYDSETIFLAVNYLDRYLSTTRVHIQRHFYLLATTCVYLASKFSEEIKEPCITDVSATCMVNSSIKEIKKMEAKILKALKWELLPATPHAILNELMASIVGLDPSTISKIVRDSHELFKVASCSDSDFLRFQPALLVFTVVGLVAPRLFDALQLGKVFRFDAALVDSCGKLLVANLKSGHGVGIARNEHRNAGTRT
ncbi:G1/S-specific cyclin-D1 [Rhizoclosmatium sp. JEL0117]|nr:G1/S-specific cyclin-D1 [Rhizoclosmatium sp. JEL0117]